MTRRRHGTRSCYLGGCRRPECSQAAREYGRDYQAVRLRLLGTGPRRDATPAIDHIRSLVATGMTPEQIGRRSGVSPSTIARLLNAEPGRTIRDGTARAILRTAPAVTARGLTRRVQALARLGWTDRAIATTAGLSRTTIDRYRTGAFRAPKLAAVEGICRAYDALAMRTPTPRDKYQRAAMTAALSRAIRGGYVSPLGWDDIDTDDAPHQSTITGPDVIDDAAVERTLAGDRVPLTRPERVELIRRLASRGLSDADMGAVVGITGRSVKRIRDEFGINTGWVAA